MTHLPRPPWIGYAARMSIWERIEQALAALANGDGVDVGRGADVAVGEVGEVASACHGLCPRAALLHHAKEAQRFGGVQGVVFSTPDHIRVEALQLIGQRPPADVERHAVDDMHLNAILHAQCTGKRGERLLQEKVVSLAGVGPILAGGLNDDDAHAATLAGFWAPGQRRAQRSGRATTIHARFSPRETT